MGQVSDPEVVAAKALNLFILFGLLDNEKMISGKII
jgi:hypothetical protein